MVEPGQDPSQGTQTASAWAPFRRGLLLTVLLGFGSQLLAGLALLLFTRRGQGSNEGLDQVIWMFMADIAAFGLGALGLIVGTVTRPRGQRGAFLGGAALGLGLALLLTLPTCLGVSAIVRK